MTRSLIHAQSEHWDRWIWNEWRGQARSDNPWIHHTAALLMHALWPVNLIRQQAIPKQHFEWYEKKYPGWTNVYGPMWEMAAEVADPSSGALALQAFPELPPLCRVCLLPTVFPRIDGSLLIEEHQGRPHPFCSTTCLERFQRQPQRYLAHRNFGEKFHGWDLDEVVVELGLLRDDGKTLVGQPHLDLERMWTIDDIRRVGYEIKYPFAA